jgi:enoyl-CoA hydratase
MDELDGRSDLRVGIIAGAGGHFSSGMDLKAFAAGERPWLHGRGFAGLVERPPKKPLIAAVEGCALAGGLEIALACDLLVASKSAFFGIPEVQRGLAAIAGGLMRLPTRLPRALAMELAGVVLLRRGQFDFRRRRPTDGGQSGSRQGQQAVPQTRPEGAR